MSIVRLNNTNKEIEKQIREVERICKEYENLNGRLFLDTSLNIDTDMKSIFLYYEDNRLVSLLIVFMPTSEEAEISAYPLPSFRRKGFFTQLLNEAVKELQRFKPVDLLFVCEPQSQDGAAAVKKLTGQLEFTEYQLRFNPSFYKLEAHSCSRLKIQKADLKNLESMIQLSQQIFQDDYEDAKSMIMKSFESEHRTKYIASLNDEQVGIGGVYSEGNDAYLFGLGILPEFQGKGFGKELLSLLLEKIMKNGITNITLEVDSTNENAFQLYKKCGFEIEAAFDYYRLPLNS